MQKIAIIFLFLSANSFASVELNLFNPQSRMEIGQNQDYSTSTSSTFSFGYRFNESFAILAELYQSEQTSGNETLSVYNKLSETSIWGRYYIKSWLYLSLGTGFDQNQTTTSLYSETSTSTSEKYSMFAVATGVENIWSINEKMGIVTGLQLRLMNSKLFSPNTISAGLLNFGVVF